MRYTITRFLPLLLLLVSAAFAQTEISAPVRFDAGGEDNLSSFQAIKLAPEDLYSETKGYGWSEPPESAFLLAGEYTNMVRDEFTSDAVVGMEFEFKIDLAPGEWWFFFWIEAGYEAEATTKVAYNGEVMPLVWHTMKPGAESKVENLDRYRVLQTAVAAGEGAETFRFIGVEDTVRVLGMSFIPKVDAVPVGLEMVAEIVEQAGVYKAKADMDYLMHSLQRRLMVRPESPLLNYWYERAKLLADAERLQRLRGWEYVNRLSERSIFGRFYQALFLLDPLLENHNAVEEPFYERALWWRSKISYDLVIERGGDYQRKIYKEDFAKLLEMYPGDRDLLMLNGVKLEEDDPCDCFNIPAGAPQWAALQHESICRYKDYVEYWADERQDPNGEFGGKLGDDVELLRQWVPMLFYGDSTTYASWMKLAKAVWKDPKVDRGFSRKPIDVEHASEFIADSTPELILVNEDSTVYKVLHYSVEHFRDLWTLRNDEGRRYFKSSWYSSTEVVTEPPKNRDLGYNVRSAKALLYLAGKTRDPETIELLHEWARGWAYMSMTTDKGKPAGIVPASVRGTDESINGDLETWYSAQMYWDYFEWEANAGSMILDMLNAVYYMTGDQTLLEPIETSLELVSRHLEAVEENEIDEFTIGSEAWAAAVLVEEGGFWLAVQAWRILTGKDTYDALVLKHGTPYIKYLLTAEETYLEEGLLFLLKQQRVNFAMHADLGVHTDRLGYTGEEQLKAMLTGDAGSNHAPLLAVTWNKTPDGITALVKDFGAETLFIEIYSFADSPEEVTFRPWLLQTGSYTMQVTADGETREEAYELGEPGQRTSVMIEPGVSTVVQIKK